MMAPSDKTFLIIDSNAVVHRAFHALPPLTTKTGEPMGAVYGFLLVFLKAIKDFNPEFIAATFDFPAPTFRHKKFKGYKAKRPRAAEELYLQIPRVKEFLSYFNVPVFEKEGFEADDIIGTLSFLAARRQPPVKTIILTGDLDALQLIGGNTSVYALRRGVKDAILYDEKAAKEKFCGIGPESLVDFKALRGDPSDNIPGISGIGEKTAVELLLKFKDLKNLYEELGKNSREIQALRPNLREMISAQKEQAFLSRELAEIKRDVPLDFNLAECRWADYDKEKITKALQGYEFYSLIKKLPGAGIEEKKEKRENLKLW
jgi:DNA polymerase I